MPGRQTLECASKTLDDVGLGKIDRAELLGTGSPWREMQGKVGKYLEVLSGLTQKTRLRDDDNTR